MHHDLFHHIEKMARISHIGMHRDHGDYIIDTHDDYVCDEVWSLYAEVYPRTGGVSTLLEWDDNFMSFQETWDEAKKAKEFQKGLCVQ